MTTNLQITVEVSFAPEHFNRVCQATVPAVWTAEAVEGCPWIDGSSEYDPRRIYGQDVTRSGAIQDLINHLRDFGYHGRLRISG